MKKKLLGLLLIVSMMLSIMPVTTFAEDNVDISGTETVYNAVTESEQKQELTAAEKVQALIDALPEANAITVENRTDVEEQLTAIDDEKILLTDEERNLLDFTKYDAAITALNELDNMGVANVPIVVGIGTGDFTVIGGTIDVDYSYSDNTLKILTGTPLTISGTTTTDRIVVQKDISANITLAGVDIDVSSDREDCAFEIENDSNEEVIITVADNTTNRLKSGWERAGLEKEGTNGSLKIQCEHSAQNGHICTETCGKLQASSTRGAGIGSGDSVDDSGAVSNITITGGIVTASSVNGGGIGSGNGDSDSGAVSNIMITGGIVTASSTNGGGTGSGYATGFSGAVSNITITGGIVTASSTDGGGIGSGKSDGDSGAVNNITITGGSVKASSIGYSPTNGSAEVYLCTIENSNCEGVIIDDEVYKPYNHTAIDSTDTKLYAYLTGATHTVQIGSSTYTYTFDSNTNTFSSGTSSMVTHGNDYVISVKNSGETLEYITDYSYQNGVLTINSDKAVTIRMNDGVTTTTDKIVVAENVNANMTLLGDVIMGEAMEVKGTALIYVDGHTFVNKAGSNVSDSNTITFKNGDDIYAYEVISSNNRSYEINEPSKGGYEFDSWYNGNTKYVFGNTLNSSVTLEAQWTAKGGYNVSFDTDGGTVVAGKTNVKWTDKVLDGVTNPTKDGYKFDGWYCGNQLVTVATKYEDLAFNDTVISIILTAQWKDNLAPTGEIKISNNSWKSFLDNITFGLFFKDTQEVTITAQDNSGETVKIEYLLSDKELSSDELAKATFTAYSDKFNIEPNNEYVIYAKLTDTTGNVTYINSNGIVLDNVVPVITGIEDGKTYCAAQTVTVTEKYADTVTVNGNSVTLDVNGQFTLSPAEVEQKIVVTDKAGNKTEMTVTVNDGHTYEWKNENGQYWQKCTVCDHETDKKDIPEIVINGADKVCNGHDYTFTFTLPEGLRNLTAGYDCGLGDQLDVTDSGNGIYTVIVKADAYKNGYENGITNLEVIAAAETVEGYLISVSKQVEILSEHIGGTATCTEKAVCEICGDSYGALNSSNHVDSLKHTEAKSATTLAEGNIEYWHCENCGKYFSDKDAKNEIQLSDTVVAKLSETDDNKADDSKPSTDNKADDSKPSTDNKADDSKPSTDNKADNKKVTTENKSSDNKAVKTGDNSHMTAWLTLLLASVGLLAVVGVYGRKKKDSKK